MSKKTNSKKLALKCKTVTRIEVSYKDLEKFIEKVYGKRYNVVGGEQWNNDSNYSFIVKKRDINQWDQKKLDTFEDYSLDTILTDLANKKLIKTGNYLIRVYW
jgi:hypothetical protein